MKSFKLKQFLFNVGAWLRDHRTVVFSIQLTIVIIYALLLIIPAIMPLPGNFDHILTNITVFAQFVFWGIWWPFVLLSMVLFGRLWCGVMCPEGALAEWSSKFSLNRPIPKWIRWAGWPFVAFVVLTIYGQLVSVYQYPLAALLVLGGSTVAAMAIGFIYVRNKRIWCRFLCPVNGVFALLSKLAPMHYKVNIDNWDAAKQKTFTIHPVNCAPLQPLRKMQGNSGCHMCGRCSGYRNAIALSPRSVSEEIVNIAKKETDIWQTLLILFGLLGIAIGAFHWTVSPLFIEYKQSIAWFLVERDIMWPLQTNTPWYLLTNYPDNNDVFSWLDGFCIITYIVMTSLVMGFGILINLMIANWIAGKFSWNKIHHLAQAFIPIAGLGVFLGLSATTASLLKADGVPMFWANDFRLALLVIADIFTFYLAVNIIKQWTNSIIKLIISLLFVVISIALINAAWGFMFWWW